MTILLINPPCRAAIAVPLGLAYIASVLRESGHKIKVLDINAYRYPLSEVEERIKSEDYDCVGIGGLTTTYKYVKQLSFLIRKHRPEVPIIAGNMVATASPEALLKNSEVDIAVIDEGEITCRELLKALVEGSDLGRVSGICYKQDGQIRRTAERERINELDELPLPAREIFPMEIYFEHIIYPGFEGQRGIHLSTTRGCPYNCNFCSRCFGRKVVKRSAKNIIEEVKFLKERYNIQYFSIFDDLFLVDKKRVMDFCDMLMDEKLNLKWGTSARVNIVDGQILGRMAKSGCIGLLYGFESGSQRILDIIGKRFTVRQAEEAIRLTRRAGIEIYPAFMIGMLGENKESISETVDFIIRNRLGDDRFLFATPLPRSALYEEARKMGKIPDEDRYLESLGEFRTNLAVNLTQFSDAQLFELKQQAEDKIRRNFSFSLRLKRLISESRRRINQVMQNYRKNGLRQAVKFVFSRIKYKLGIYPDKA